ncbi:hypothetical protein DAERI_060132 [Deinococcus aerius]|uniref:Uncharacterized protein n=1 Tax=Deinococcus aerius TaxID=200253 RepID=A0A2I9CVE0_9DEIO|nr:hypothetical protein [Deinococcus aerius]GBF05872.1 hypothetical protein DAERI_060132 [Deinococcus aerius]
MIVYAQATAQDLLEAIPAYEAVGCDLAAISVAWMRKYTRDVALGTFEVRKVSFPAVNFSSVHLILSPLVRDEDGRRTLAPVAAWIVANGVTDLRIVGEGHWNRQHQYSRNGGASWGRMAVSGSAPRQPAPTQTVEPDIPAPEEVPT